jgi:uncharacterized protein (DUF2062 family)
MPRWLERLLHTHDSPRRTASAFALGVFFGFSPLLGLHAILGVAFAFLLGLNRVAVILGVYSNLPWILPAYYTLTTMAGAVVLGITLPPGVLDDLRSTVSSPTLAEIRRLATSLSPLLGAFVLGSTVGALALAGLAYQASLAMILSHRRRARQQAREPIDT